MIKALIFDCFGVLITDALSLILEEVKKNDTEKASRIVGLVNAASSGKISFMQSRQAIAAELGLSLEEYIDKLQNQEAKNQELLDYIERLRKNYKTAVLSNVGKGGLALRFPTNELNRYFDVVVASGDIGYAKPDAEAFDITAFKLGVEVGDCVMIDDRIYYCEAARSAGMQSLLYVSNDQIKNDLSKLLK